jgi:hypothetical protein
MFESQGGVITECKEYAAAGLAGRNAGTVQLTNSRYASSQPDFTDSHV